MNIDTYTHIDTHAQTLKIMQTHTYLISHIHIHRYTLTLKQTHTHIEETQT